MIRLLRALLALSLFVSGWGWNDIPGFLHDPARCVFAGVLLLFGLISPIQPLSQARSGVGEMPLGLALASLVLIPSLIAGAVLLAYADRHAILVTQGEWRRWIGVGLFALGGCIQFSSMRQLGRQYSPMVLLQSSHQLVQRGLYSYIRHPMYAGLLLALPGISASFRSVLALPIAIATAAFVYIRIRAEERMLAARFGPEFETYKQRTKMLIPTLF